MVAAPKTGKPATVTKPGLKPASGETSTPTPKAGGGAVARPQTAKNIEDKKVGKATGKLPGGGLGPQFDTRKSTVSEDSDDPIAQSLA